MGKSRFLLPTNGEGEESADATVICSVEDLSLAHYRQQGFDQGKLLLFFKISIHSSTSQNIAHTFSSTVFWLFSLLSTL